MPPRSYRALGLALVLFGLVASSASADTTIACDPCSYPYQQWVDEARVPTPDRTVPVTEAEDLTMSCGSPALACTDGNTVWIESWAFSHKPSFLHELGHIFALEHPALAAFTDERFAFAYSLCARLVRIDPRWHYTGPRPGFQGRALLATCAAIRRSS